MNALYSLYDALVSINVPSERARSVVDAMERDMTIILATKSDLAAAQVLLKRDIDSVRESLEQKIDSAFGTLDQKIDSVRDSLAQRLDSMRVMLENKLELLRSSMTIRLGSIQVVSMGILFAALKPT